MNPYAKTVRVCSADDRGIPLRLDVRAPAGRFLSCVLHMAPYAERPPGHAASPETQR